MEKTQGGVQDLHGPAALNDPTRSRFEGLEKTQIGLRLDRGQL